MSDKQHIFHLESVFAGGDGTASSDGGNISYGLPVDFGGQSGRTNPEQLLLASVSACYSLTLAVLAERRKLPFVRVEMEAEGIVSQQPGGTLKYESISLKPKIIMSGADESQLKSITDFAHKAEQYCPISGAIRGQVVMTVEPTIINE